ncbi:hypothetical protein PCANC_00269 [Puccinia coronata f. sp. avenae]|uniref:Uncharacterized protein n=1 Tax=Puccinia coronata f. sp. avenae TaxID=200324 RepID=A0A2N5W8Y8_9BASI|nr:hypothetical protein PCANC_00269 [Puccinia coronata f. sp. avenae]
MNTDRSICRKQFSEATDVTSVAQTDFMSAGPTDTLEQRNNVSVGPADVTSVYKTDVTSVAATDLAAGGCNRYNPFGGDSTFPCAFFYHLAGTDGHCQKIWLGWLHPSLYWMRPSNSNSGAHHRVNH